MSNMQVAESIAFLLPPTAGLAWQHAEMECRSHEIDEPKLRFGVQT
jgi:hypothetical protein